MSKVTVSVPVVELEKLEQARLELFEFINKYIPGEKAKFNFESIIKYFQPNVDSCQ